MAHVILDMAQPSEFGEPLVKRPYLKGFTLRKVPRLTSTASTASELAFYGQLIQQLISRRKQMKISQESLSQIMGVSDGMVAKWESGHKMPSSFYLMCWAQSLELEIKCQSPD
jgi:ribosome-binding protein aMBF1 (putative translation factor)